MVMIIMTTMVMMMVVNCTWDELVVEHYLANNNEEII